MSLVEPSVDVPVLAVASTVHLALAALRHHRQPGVLALVSLLLAGLPWVLPSPAGLALGAIAHVAWFVVCERWGKAAAPATASRPTAPTAPRSQAPRPSAPAAKGFVQVPVLGVFDESPDIRTFRFARPEGFAFTAGQFLTVRLRTDGRELVRCYSISSPPGASGYLEISVKRQGLVSSALHASLRPGSLVSVRPPAGVFKYPEHDDRPLVLLAGGIGITPLLSMLRHAVLAEPTRRVTLFYCARRECDFAFRDELLAIARRHPQVRVCLAASREATHPDVYPGRIDEALIVSAAPDVAHGLALLCGPQSMIDELTALLGRLGLSPGQIRSELFEAAVASSSRPREGAVAAAAGPAAGGGHRVTATRSGRETTCAPGQTLLEAAEAGGIDIPSLCRAGVCGTCRTRVVEGDVACSSATLDEADRAAGYVLACVASPQGDCAIEA